MTETKHETYTSRNDIERLVEYFDISTNEAGEASFEAFIVWRKMYNEKQKGHIDIGEFDIQSQVSMFDHDLRSLYYDDTKTAKLNADGDV